MTRYIFFDLGKVLLDFDHARARAQISQLVGIRESVVQDLVFDDGLLLEFETGRIDGERFHRAFCEATGTSSRLEEFLDAYSDIFEVISPMETLVRRLHEQQVPLGILSNTSAAHWNHVWDGRFEFLNNSFRDSVLSFEVGSMKPDRAIYDMAIRTAGCDPGEIFFCDDRQENVDGAKSAGIDAILFESPNQIEAEVMSRVSGAI